MELVVFLAYAALGGLTWKIESCLDDQETPDSPIRFTNFKIQVMTFGAPQLGNIIFIRLINKFLKIYRVTHTNDHVPHFPSPEIEDHILEHHELKLWITLISFDQESLGSLPCGCPKTEYFIWESQDSEHVSKPWNQTEVLDETFFPDGRNSGENPECNAEQSIAEVPRKFIHTGLYFGVEMGN
ncbi:hypothetical protein G9A89_015316 [Geosiphon pyriformis]|nr:hypothetical protein G9A89_015316 [Geosiphon pyriformis]